MMMRNILLRGPRMMMRDILLLLLARASAECSPLPCLRDTGFPGNDLEPPPGVPNPHPAAGYQGCAFACYARPDCVAFTSIDAGTGACAAPGGCCLLKQIIDCIAVVSAPNLFNLYVS